MLQEERKKTPKNAINSWKRFQLKDHTEGLQTRLKPPYTHLQSVNRKNCHMKAIPFQPCSRRIGHF